MYLAYTKIIREIDQINYVYHYIIYIKIKYNYITYTRFTHKPFYHKNVWIILNTLVHNIMMIYIILYE